MNPPSTPPQRIRLSRRKDWRMPPNTVKVDRTNRIYGNPFRVGPDGSAEDCVGKFKAMIAGNIWSEPNKDSIKHDLRGKNLACWCPIGSPCHADVLLELANGKDCVDLQRQSGKIATPPPN